VSTSGGVALPQASTGRAGAPTSGTWIANTVAVDTAGNLWVCTTSGTPGTWAQVTGATPTPAMVLIADQVLSGAASNITFNSIPGTYNHLRLVALLASSDAAVTDFVIMQFNGDTAAHYDRNYVAASDAAVNAGDSVAASNIGVGAMPGTSDSAGVVGILTVDIPGYALTTFNKACKMWGSFIPTGNPAQNNQQLTTGQWRSTAAITEIVLAPQTGPNFVTGSGAWLYGVT
jgi:hypothetical protein